MGDNKLPTKINLYSYNSKTVNSHIDISPAVLNECLDNDNMTWVHITGLRDTDIIKDVFLQFGIDFLTRQDVLNPEHLPKIEEHDEYNVVIMKMLYRGDSNDYEPAHFCVIQKKSVLVTFAEKESDIIKDVVSALYDNTLKIRQKQVDYLLSVIINGVVSSYMSIIAKMEDDLEDMEESLIVTGTYKNFTAESIQQFRKNYRTIKKCVSPLKEHFSKLLHLDNSHIMESHYPFFNDVNDHIMYVQQTMENCRDLMAAIGDLYVSQNDRKLNGIMKQLTIVSTIFIPLTFLAGIWGMNFEYMPELSWKYGYAMAWGLILLTGIALCIFFRHKKW